MQEVPVVDKEAVEPDDLEVKARSSASRRVAGQLSLSTRTGSLPSPSGLVALRRECGASFGREVGFAARTGFVLFGTLVLGQAKSPELGDLTALLVERHHLAFENEASGCLPPSSTSRAGHNPQPFEQQRVDGLVPQTGMKPQCSFDDAVWGKLR